MATIEQRGAGFRAQVRLRGQRAYATFSELQEAQKWAVQTEKRIRDGETLRPYDETENPTVSHVLERYAREVSPKRKSGEFERSRIRFFNRSFPCLQKRCSDFTSADVREIRRQREKSLTVKGNTKRPVSAGTILREMGILAGIFTYAIEEWSMPFASIPTKGVRRPSMPRPRWRRIKDAEARALLDALGYKEGAAPTTPREFVGWSFLFAIETAMRKGEILAMTWGNVHKAERFVHLPTTKNGSRRDVPLSRRAIELLGMLKQGKPGDRVVGVNYNNFEKHFRLAREAAGIEDLHFHDTRHEGTTRLATKLTNVLELAAVTGHTNIQMLKIYFNPTATEMAYRLD